MEIFPKKLLDKFLKKNHEYTGRVTAKTCEKKHEMKPGAVHE